MKRIISMIVVVACIFTSNIQFVSSDVNDTDIYLSDVYEQMGIQQNLLRNSDATGYTVSDSAYLYNFNDEPVAIYYAFVPEAYAIYDFETGIVLEYAPDHAHPVYTDSEKKYYYNGVFSYYCKIDKGYQNLINGTIIGFEEALDSINGFYSDVYYDDINSHSEVSPRTAVQVGELENSTRFYNCNVTTNFDEFYPEFTQERLNNVPGVCGSLACAILLAYYDDYLSNLAGQSGDFADDEKKISGTVSNQTYGIDLVKELVLHIEPSGNGSFLLDTGMTEYLKDHSIDGTLAMTIYNGYNEVKSAVNQGYPLIVGTIDHYCVGIGYTNQNGYNQIKVNYGWGENHQSSKAYISAYTIISTWELIIN